MLEDVYQLMEGGETKAAEFDLETIQYQESHHFTLYRILFMVVNFLILLANNMFFKGENVSQT